MSKKEFSEFLKRQTPGVLQEEKPIDWVAEKERWLRQLSTLYNMVETFLKEYTDSGQIAISYNNMELSEENLGCYTVRAMTLAFGTNRVALTPIGTLLIGTAGRVDMTGPRGTVRLILADKDSTGLRVQVRVLDPTAPAQREVAKPINWEWKVVVTNPPRLPYQYTRTVPSVPVGSIAAAPRMTYLKLTQDTFLDALMGISNG
jgi:hypothetical protein